MAARSTPVADLAAAVMEGDDELKGRVRGFVNSCLDEAEQLLSYGTPQTKAGVIRTVMPALVKVLGEEKQGDEMAVLRNEVEQMFAEVRSGIGNPVAEKAEEPDEAPVDRRRGK